MERIRNGCVLSLFSTPTCQLLYRHSAPCMWGNVRHGGGVWFPPSSAQRHFPPCCMVPTKPPSFAVPLLISLFLTIIKSLSKAGICHSPISDHFSHSDLHPKVPSTSMLLTSAQTQTCDPLPLRPKCWDDHPVPCHSWSKSSVNQFANAVCDIPATEDQISVLRTGVFFPQPFLG